MRPSRRRRPIVVAAVAAALGAAPASAQAGEGAGPIACAVLAAVGLVVLAALGVGIWLVVRWMRRRPAGAGPSGLVAALVIAAGLFAFVAIGGIVTALVVPNFLAALHKAKTKRTVVDLSAVASALRAYRDEHGSYPPAASAAEVRALVEPGFGHELTVTDGWDRPWHYRCLAAGDEPCGRFLLISAGRDGELEDPPPAWADPEAGWDADIVVGPEGVLTGPGWLIEGLSVRHGTGLGPGPSEPAR
jgi:hypothetical protein